MKKIKSQKGITLIALIITIVVLLILAVVTIGTVKDSGIIGHAQNATTNYKVAQEKEQIMLGYSEYKISSLKNSDAQLEVESAKSVTGGKDTGWTVEFESGNTYKLSPNGNIGNNESNGNIDTDEPVVNDNPNDWDIAYVHNGTNWESTPVDKTAEGAAEKVAAAKIVAKFYEVELATEEVPQNQLMFTDDTVIPFPALNKRYKLFIEGTGNMGTMVRI